jgi:REP element-mobilizing transposase RayT
MDLLFLAQDHVHLYVESDGELSVVEEFSSIKDKLGGDTELWDEAYFVETIGL